MTEFQKHIIGFCTTVYVWIPGQVSDLLKSLENRELLFKLTVNEKVNNS